MRGVTIEFLQYTWARETLGGFAGHGILRRSRDWPAKFGTPGGELPELSILPGMLAFSYRLADKPGPVDVFFFTRQGWSIFGSRQYVGLDGDGRPGNSLVNLFVDMTGTVGALDAMSFLLGPNDVPAIGIEDPPQDGLDPLSISVPDSWQEEPTVELEGKDLLWRALLDQGLATCPVGQLEDVFQLLLVGSRIMSVGYARTVPFHTRTSSDGARELWLGEPGAGSVPPERLDPGPWGAVEFRRALGRVVANAEGTEASASEIWSSNTPIDADDQLHVLTELIVSLRDPYTLPAEEIAATWPYHRDPARRLNALNALAFKLSELDEAERLDLVRQIPVSHELATSLVTLAQGHLAREQKPPVVRTALDIISVLGDDATFTQALSALPAEGELVVSGDFVERAVRLGSPNDKRLLALVRPHPQFLPAVEAADNDWWPWALAQQLAGEVSRPQIAERVPSMDGSALVEIVRQVLDDGNQPKDVWPRLVETAGGDRAADVFEQCGSDAVSFLVSEGVGAMSSSAREAFLDRHLETLLVALGWHRSAAAMMTIVGRGQRRSTARRWTLIGLLIGLVVGFAAGFLLFH